MTCFNCGKNETNFKYTEVINGVKKEIALCNKCANELGFANMELNLPIDFSSFLSEFLNEYTDPAFETILDSPKQLKCNKCNMTFDEFMSTGKFGCSNCYNVFDVKIEPMLKKIQGQSKHVRKAETGGKRTNVGVDAQHTSSKDKTPTNNIDDLKQQLKEAIRTENYEEAAKIRDKIKGIEM